MQVWNNWIGMGDLNAFPQLRSNGVIRCLIIKPTRLRTSFVSAYYHVHNNSVRIAANYYYYYWLVVLFSCAYPQFVGPLSHYDLIFSLGYRTVMGSCRWEISPFSIKLVVFFLYPAYLVYRTVKLLWFISFIWAWWGVL